MHMRALALVSATDAYNLFEYCGIPMPGTKRPLTKDKEVEELLVAAVLLKIRKKRRRLK